MPGTTIQVTGGGSGVGIAALINGTTDIAASSRPIKTSEIDKLKARFATAATRSRSRATVCRSTSMRATR